MSNIIPHPSFRSIQYVDCIMRDTEIVYKLGVTEGKLGT